MQIRLADYVADFLTAHDITDCFMVTGGGAMHLNDALGHKAGLHCTFNHHEQACAIAAESYARLENRIAALCVTTGPGGTNAITGVLGGWLDSIPMLVISGQVRYDTTARYAERFTGGLPLRAVGDQEFDITRAVSCRDAGGSGGYPLYAGKILLSGHARSARTVLDRHPCQLPGYDD